MAQWHVDKPVIYAKGDSYFILIPGRVNKQLNISSETSCLAIEKKPESEHIVDLLNI